MSEGGAHSQTNNAPNAQATPTPTPTANVIKASSRSRRDEGDGTYDGQIGHAYLHLDDDAPESEGRELGFITLAEAAEIARQHEVDLDVDGPTQ